MTDDVKGLVERLREPWTQFQSRRVAVEYEAATTLESQAKQIAVLREALGLWGPIGEIVAECERQVGVEGWTPEHDDEHTEGELAMAAITYGMPSWFQEWLVNNDIRTWPFEGQPNFKNVRRDLIRAAALIVAEIERLDRAGEGKP